MMALEKRITTREFVRHTKRYKDLFLAGKLHVLLLPLDGEQYLRITVDSQRKKARTGRELAALFRSLPRPITIERPQWMWDEWERQLKKRRSGRAA
jgi:hypothetical protein